MAGNKSKGKTKAKATADGGTKGKAEESAFEWKPTLVCIATYRVLEDNDKLDQFEEKGLPFDKAGDHLLSELRYFPKTTNNPDIIELVAAGVGRSFLTFIVRNFTVSRESDQISDADILDAIASEFASTKSTFATLAQTVDEKIRFADEVQK